MERADEAAIGLGRAYALLGIVSATVRPSADGTRLSVICPQVDQAGVAQLLLKGILAMGVEPKQLAGMLWQAIDFLEAKPVVTH